MINQAHQSSLKLKMQLSEYCWFKSISILSYRDTYTISVKVLPKTLEQERKVISVVPTTIDGFLVRLEDISLRTKC